MFLLPFCWDGSEDFPQMIVTKEEQRPSGDKVSADPIVGTSGGGGDFYRKHNTSSFSTQAVGQHHSAGRSAAWRRCGCELWPCSSGVEPDSDSCPIFVDFNGRMSPGGYRVRQHDSGRHTLYVGNVTASSLMMRTPFSSSLLVSAHG